MTGSVLKILSQANVATHFVTTEGVKIEKSEYLKKNILKRFWFHIKKGNFDKHKVFGKLALESINISDWVHDSQSLKISGSDTELSMDHLKTLVGNLKYFKEKLENIAPENKSKKDEETLKIIKPLLAKLNPHETAFEIQEGHKDAELFDLYKSENSIVREAAKNRINFKFSHNRFNEDDWIYVLTDAALSGPFGEMAKEKLVHAMNNGSIDLEKIINHSALPKDIIELAQHLKDLAAKIHSGSLDEEIDQDYLDKQNSTFIARAIEERKSLLTSMRNKFVHAQHWKTLVDLYDDKSFSEYFKTKIVQELQMVIPKINGEFNDRLPNHYQVYTELDLMLSDEKFNQLPADLKCLAQNTLDSFVKELEPLSKPFELVRFLDESKYPKTICLIAEKKIIQYIHIADRPDKLETLINSTNLNVKRAAEEQKLHLSKLQEHHQQDVLFVEQSKKTSALANTDKKQGLGILRKIGETLRIVDTKEEIEINKQFERVEEMVKNCSFGAFLSVFGGPGKAVKLASFQLTPDMRIFATRIFIARINRGDFAKPISELKSLEVIKDEQVRVAVIAYMQANGIEIPSSPVLAPQPNPPKKSKKPKTRIAEIS